VHLQANQQSMVESLLDPANSAFECTDDMFPSEITPPYFTSTFTLSDFHRVRHRFSQPDCTEEIVYSPPVSFNGQQWRLKVYPNGNFLIPILQCYVSVCLMIDMSRQWSIS
jgi:hypothetical protein